ncbi:MAG: phosphate propanoyltransferase [Patescibacteria group bacterium]|jgi:putative phosphotransacetylase|nr:phosphate propanoyltransferase [Patescibacteria group bacterium]
MKVIVEVSARHCHLSGKHLEKLFGRGYQLEPVKNLSQKKQYSSNSTVTIIGPKNEITDVRILGPIRDVSQVEISFTDSYYLGIKAPLKISGDLSDAAPVILSGPKGKVKLFHGLIIARRHFHCDLATAKKLKLRDGQKIKVKITGPRSLIFNEVVTRIRKDFRPRIQLDTDEGNAAFVHGQTKGEIIIN